MLSPRFKVPKGPLLVLLQMNYPLLPSWSPWDSLSRKEPTMLPQFPIRTKSSLISTSFTLFLLIQLEKGWTWFLGQNWPTDFTLWPKEQTKSLKNSSTVKTSFSLTKSAKSCPGTVWELWSFATRKFPKRLLTNSKSNSNRLLPT